MIRARTGTRDLAQLGGLWGAAPSLSACFLLFALASLGLPGLANFAGEILVLLGTFRAQPLWAILALPGLVLGPPTCCAWCSALFGPGPGGAAGHRRPDGARVAGADSPGRADHLARAAPGPAAGPAGDPGAGRPRGAAMTLLDLLALAPVLVLVMGATTLLMTGAWYHEPRPLMAGGIAVALVAAVTAGVAPPAPPEIAGLFSSAPFARYFAVLWALVAALVLMLSLRYADERGFAAGEYIALVLFSAAGWRCSPLRPAWSGCSSAWSPSPWPSTS